MRIPPCRGCGNRSARLGDGLCPRCRAALKAARKALRGPGIEPLKTHREVYDRTAMLIAELVDDLEADAELVRGALGSLSHEVSFARALVRGRELLSRSER